MKKLLTACLLFSTLFFSSSDCYAGHNEEEGYKILHEVYLDTTQWTNLYFLDETTATSVAKKLKDQPNITPLALEQFLSKHKGGYVGDIALKGKKSGGNANHVQFDEGELKLNDGKLAKRPLACNRHGCALCPTDKVLTISTDKSNGYWKYKIVCRSGH